MMTISKKGEQKMSYPISDNRFTKEKMNPSKPAGKGEAPKGKTPKGKVKIGGATV